ncbi:MAG TPA: hypothetical protein VNI53_00635 [Gammaproteobacteria bacterium]|nr:hypothetical protein [Gammaproteobacteria bacterium]
MNNMNTAVSLGRVAPTELGTARLLLQIAVQPVGNLGRAFLQPAADYSHISLVWDAELHALVGERVTTSSINLRAALFFDPPAVALLDDKGQVLNRWPLEGLTLSKLETDMQRALSGDGLQNTKFSARSVNPIDLSVLGKGETFAFTQQRDAVMELAAYYAMSAAVLDELTYTLRAGRIPHVWPHHFDYSLLTPLEKSGGERGRSITLGMSPGDGYYDQPYFYATPWPYPPADTLPVVQPPAHWHQHEWTGLVLTATDFLSRKPERETLRAYWHEAYSVLRGLLAPA